MKKIHIFWVVILILTAYIFTHQYTTDSVDDLTREVENNQNDILRLLTNNIWVLISEKSVLTGPISIPLSPIYYNARTFNKDGTGIEESTSNISRRPIDSSNFTYSLIFNKLKITQDDGHVLIEEIREIDHEKMVIYISKFDNERTYKLKK